MIKLIVGVRGTGKTKMFIELVNEALQVSSGKVVCIEKEQKLKFDVKHQARLVDTTEYSICGADALYGLICGIHARDYDTTHIFIDSALKMCAEDLEDFAKFLKLADKISDKNNFKCIITASVAPEDLPEEIIKYTE